MNRIKREGKIIIIKKKKKTKWNVMAKYTHYTHEANGIRFKPDS